MAQKSEGRSVSEPQRMKGLEDENLLLQLVGWWESRAAPSRLSEPDFRGAHRLHRQSRQLGFDESPSCSVVRGEIGCP